jgi:hypothetical protein
MSGKGKLSDLSGGAINIGVVSCGVLGVSESGLGC